MMEVTTNGSITFEIPSTIVWSRNPKIDLSFSCLSSVCDVLSELCGGVHFLIEYLIPTELMTKVGDNLDGEKAIMFSLDGSKVIFTQV